MANKVSNAYRQLLALAINAMNKRYLAIETTQCQ